jgi:hypothetical protein
MGLSLLIQNILDESKTFSMQVIPKSIFGGAADAGGTFGLTIYRGPKLMRYSQIAIFASLQGRISDETDSLENPVLESFNRRRRIPKPPY